ncbi:clathrin coat assembly protein AP180-like [Macadamia integrifolia]|uniref:clathrin coat assembly protein AP180-like n=1 Tax=Macadamia integrifolia TaxID=60698 RepID=UPI001C4EE2A9|nr:clathrin coat assembly protein AP180-like [Macadamia integrifolia]
MPSKLRKAIGAMKDQTSIGLAMVTNNNSSSLDIAILKATTHDTVPMKEKHVKEVLLLTCGSKLYASTCAQAIAKRIGRTRNWIVALKSLMLVLRIFQDGNPYFPREVLQAMKAGAKILNLSTFRDISTSNPWDYTAYIRTFALYLNDRLECYLIGKLQRRAVHKEPNNGGSHRRNDLVCDMKPPMLLDRISYWQRLLDRIIATRPTGTAKSNRLVHISLYPIVLESFDLYRDISDGLTLLLDSFFHLQYQSCVDAFQTCIKASKQYEELSEFYSSCKNMGVGRTSEYPSVQKISDELIDALREFLKDQGSFSTGNPGSPVCQPAPPEEGGSETGSQVNDRPTSLEDLIGGTDAGTSHTSHTSPSISTDQDQFEKQTKLEDLMGLNTNTSTDEEGIDSGGMDLVLFTDDNEQQPSVSGLTAMGAEDGGREGWEDMLAETVTANDISVTSSSSSSQEGFAQLRHLHQPSYNPFLQDTSEIPETSTTAIGPVAGDTDFFSLPTFQATPTFTAQESDDATASPWHVENDPFAPLSLQADQILVSSTGQQQHFLREQQLWLQHQNKIIARHANVA